MDKQQQVARVGGLEKVRFLPGGLIALCSLRDAVDLLQVWINLIPHSVPVASFACMAVLVVIAGSIRQDLGAGNRTG